MCVVCVYRTGREVQWREENVVRGRFLLCAFSYTYIVYVCVLISEMEGTGRGVLLDCLSPSLPLLRIVCGKLGLSI